MNNAANTSLTPQMDAVLDWLASDQSIATHPAFADFRRHIRYHLFDRVGTLDAWRWFKQACLSGSHPSRPPVVPG